MPLNTFAIAFMGITLIVGAIIVGIMWFVTRTRVQNPAQWKTIRDVSTWVETDQMGNKVNRSRTEISRVRV